MLLWYKFKLTMDDYDGLEAAQQFIKTILKNSGGSRSGVALFYKDNNATKKNIFFVSIPEEMTSTKEIIDRVYPLTVCERPTGQELMPLVTGANDLDDYSGLCKEWKL